MNFRRTVLIPLIVMLLLTLLVGATAFELTQRWQGASRESEAVVTRALLLNTLRGKLLQVRQILEDHPDRVPALWAEVYDIGTLLSRQPTQAGLPPSLQALLRIHPEDAAQLEPQLVDALIEQPLFSVDLKQITRHMEESRQSAEFITLSLTLSMLLLGGILTGLTAWDLNRLFSALVASRDLNISLQEDERRRIAQDLHDGVVQELVALKRNYSPDKIDHLIDNIRRVCHNLKPQILADLGLVAALEFLLEDLRATQPVAVSLALDTGIDHLPKAYELALFRIFQEGVSNIRQHARATRVSLELRREGGLLIGKLEDNGQGFDSSNIHGGMGVAGMQERLGQLGGRLEIQSRPGEGSRLSFRIPLKTEVAHVHR